MTSEGLKQAMKYLGWSGKQAAELLGTTPRTISRYLHGQQSIPDTIDKHLLFRIRVKKAMEYINQ